MKNCDSKHQIGADIAVAVALLLIILLLSVQIQDVTAARSNGYSTKQAERLLFTNRWGKNSVHAYFSGKFRPYIQISFVEDYKMVFHSPFDVGVIIYEKGIVGCVFYVSSFVYFDKDGIVVESSGNQLPDAPQITGVEFGRIMLHHPPLIDDRNIFKEVLSLTQQLPVYDIAVDRTQYDSHEQATLFIGIVEVTMGNHADIDRKISTLNGILRTQSQLIEVSGVMKLDNYSESNSRVGVTFKKK